MSKEITICSTGDLMICDSPLYASIGVGALYGNKASELFANCEYVFQNADVTIGNFETVVHYPANGSIKENQMCCEEEVVRDLARAGFSILNLANNHCLQHGAEGFRQTVNACERNGIQPIGIRDEKAYMMEVRGVRLAFLSLCIHREWYLPDNVLYEDRIDKILEMVSELRKADGGLVIVVSVHWGDEFATYPSNAQIALGHKLVDLGADIVLGHHPHVFQGIEEYKEGLIVYSQGNFISDMVPEMCRQTGIVKISVSSDEDHNSISYELIPLCIGSDFVPAPGSDSWMNGRTKALKNAVNGKYSDDDYWKRVGKNHGIAHNSFKSFFKRNVLKYKKRIAVKMILEFVGRKLKRVAGTSTDGRVSSMDPVIEQVLKKYEEKNQNI